MADVDKKPHRSWGPNTINNYTDRDVEWLKSLVEYANRLYAVKEVGESLTPHLQFFITFKKPMRFAAVKKLHGTCSWRVSQSEFHADLYQNKVDSELVVNHRHTEQGKRTDMEIARQAVADGLKPHEFWAIAPSYNALRIYEKRGDFMAKPARWDKVFIFWLYGPSGMGKSRWARTTFPECYEKPNGKWWPMYEKHEVVLWDDVREGDYTLQGFLRVIDGEPTIQEVKGGSVWVNPKVWVITSQKHPGTYWQNEDALDQVTNRCSKIFHINMKGMQPDLSGLGFTRP